MAKKFYKNEKFQKVFYPIMYFLLLSVFVCSACFAFSKLYYEKIYVTGSSMEPTLIGQGTDGGEGYSHYGKADKSRRVVDRLARFDVVITYFPSDWHVGDDGVYKIKRLWGFPGETLNLTYESDEVIFTVSSNGTTICEYKAPLENNLSIFNVGYKTFKVKGGSLRNLSNYELKSDEYFLMGDNWTVSSDSYWNKSKDGYITNNLIQGKVVQIQGTARIVDGKLVDKRPIYGMFEF